jgi:hypothetical protein
MNGFLCCAVQVRSGLASLTSRVGSIEFSVGIRRAEMSIGSS